MVSAFNPLSIPATNLKAGYAVKLGFPPADHDDLAENECGHAFSIDLVAVDPSMKGVPIACRLANPIMFVSFRPDDEVVNGPRADDPLHLANNALAAVQLREHDLELGVLVVPDDRVDGPAVPGSPIHAARRGCMQRSRKVRFVLKSLDDLPRVARSAPIEGDRHSKPELEEGPGRDLLEMLDRILPAGRDALLCGAWVGAG